MSASIPANSFTSTSKSSANSAGSAIASLAIDVGRATCVLAVKGRLGIRACLHRRCFPDGLQPGHEEREKGCAVAFLRAAVAYYASLGVTVERVMTDNGSCYKSFAFQKACKRLGIKHIRTKPYTPKTNGKAERFIQTSLREWAYAQDNEKVPAYGVCGLHCRAHALSHCFCRNLTNDPVQYRKTFKCPLILVLPPHRRTEVLV